MRINIVMCLAFGLILGLFGTGLAESASYGVKFSTDSDETEIPDDIHVQFYMGAPSNNVLSGASMIPTPPAPSGAVTWTSVGHDAFNVDCSGASVGAGGETHLKFDFSSGGGGSEEIDFCWWTEDGTRLTNVPITVENVDYE